MTKLSFNCLGLGLIISQNTRKAAMTAAKASVKQKKVNGEFRFFLSFEPRGTHRTNKVRALAAVHNVFGMTSTLTVPSFTQRK